MIYIKPLSEYRYNLTAQKLQGLTRLTQLKIPTVPSPFVILPSLYQEYLTSGKLPANAIEELQKTFFSIIRQKETITLRNSIFEENHPAISFAVHNTLNIRSFDLFIKKVIMAYRTVSRQAFNPAQTEVCLFYYAFYSSEKCGLLLSDNGQGEIFLQAILGQHTTLILRGDLKPDEYLISKKTYCITSRRVTRKEFRMKKITSGIVKIRVKQSEQNLPVLTDEQILKTAKLSQIMERSFGPQEMEWAMLDDGRIIFQETRDFIPDKKLHIDGVQVINPREIKGETVVLKHKPRHLSLADKIVVTANLSINFINQLCFLYRPLAVMLTKGSITSHAATILREAGITTVIAYGFRLRPRTRVQITKEGSVHYI